MGIIEDVKEAVKLSQQVNNVDLYRKLVDLQLEVMELTEQLKLKNESIAELKKIQSMREKLKCINSAYYEVDKDGQPFDGPFCTKCLDVDGKICRLLINEIGASNEAVFCPNCKASFPSGKACTFLLKS